VSVAGKRCVFRFSSISKREQFLMRMVGQAIFELIATEGAYVRDLQLIVEVRGHYI
jgi:hypothetical protein